MKKKLIYIIICFLAITLLTVGIVLVVRLNKTSSEPNNKIPITSYTVSLKDSPGFELSSIPYNGENELALFITSFEEHALADVEITFLDSGYQIISTNTSSIAYLASQKQYLISMPVAKEEVKFVEVRIKLQKDDDGEEIRTEEVMLDSNKLSFDIDDKVDESNNATITLKAKNPYGQAIQLINGYVLLYNSDTLVDAIPYSAIDVVQDGEITVKVNTILHDTTGVFKYNKIKIIINELL